MQVEATLTPMQSCRYLRGVGPAVAKKLALLGMETIQDVLLHLPFRYEDRTRLTPLSQLRVNDRVLIEGKIVARHAPWKGKTRLLLTITDGTSYVSLRFFHGSLVQFQRYQEGVRVRCYGDIRDGAQGFELVHPECECVNATTLLPITLTPVYPTTESLHQGTLRRVIHAALDLLSPTYLPELVTASMSLVDALRYVHAPPANADITALTHGTHPCQQRLSFEELLAHRIAFLQRREERLTHGAPVFRIDHEASTVFQAQLPFTLTDAQQRVTQEIFADLARDQPMLRLVQGDVGSGKTVVAALAAQQAIVNGYQVAIMAPTELLASQHVKNFMTWFSAFTISVGYCVGSLTAATRKKELQRISTGEVNVVVGTHALFQSGIQFHRLGLVIIDEQHRFGVGQRLALCEKGRDVHQLMMTATPIPRTLAMTAYADVDLSLIDELPPGRQPIQTALVSDNKRADVIARVLHAIQSGAQVYWVCTLIEESEVVDAHAAEVLFDTLSQSLPGVRVALVHGRMKTAEKEKVMRDFKENTVQLLVATTVIEVGVDVPNANVMVIENAERLGLSQLHQLRGRVGRGHAQSYCVLLHGRALSTMAKQRLTTLRDCHDGHVIAEKDLELRGPGDVIGTRQSGDMQFRVADLRRDHDLLESVMAASRTLSLAAQEALMQRWLRESIKYQNA